MLIILVMRYQFVTIVHVSYVMKKKPKINISALLKKHKAGKSIGSTNRARLVARGLIARKSGPHKGKKKDLGKRGKT